MSKSGGEWSVVSPSLVFSPRQAPEWRGWPSVRPRPCLPTGDRVRPSCPNSGDTNMWRTSTRRSSPPSGGWRTRAWGGRTGWWGTLQYKPITTVSMPRGEEHLQGDGGCSDLRYWSKVMICDFQPSTDRWFSGHRRQPIALPLSKPKYKYQSYWAGPSLPPPQPTPYQVRMGSTLSPVNTRISHISG